DSCEGAVPLVDGAYSLEGYTADPNCNAICGGASRWFTVVVPPWQTMHVNIASNDINQGGIAALDLDLPCWQGASQTSNVGGWQPFGASIPPAPTVVVNPTPLSRTVGIAVWDQQTVSSGSFEISHSLQATGCGDGYFDSNGQFGAPENCDDGNNATGD